MNILAYISIYIRNEYIVINNDSITQFKTFGSDISGKGVQIKCHTKWMEKNKMGPRKVVTLKSHVKKIEYVCD